MHGQVRLRHIEQITNLIEIDFEVGNFDLKLKISIQCINMVKYVLYNARYNTLMTITIQYTLSKRDNRRSSIIFRKVDSGTSMVCVFPLEVCP